MSTQKLILPYKFRFIGVFTAVGAIVLDGILESSSPDTNAISLGFKILEIIGLFIFINSKEKIEDERIDHLRLIAFRISYMIVGIIGILFLIFDFFRLDFIGKEGIPLLIITMIVSYQLAFLFLRRKEGDFAKSNSTEL
jgi:hypothetical protein